MNERRLVRVKGLSKARSQRLEPLNPNTLPIQRRRNAPSGEVLRGVLIIFVILNNYKLFVLNVLAKCMYDEQWERRVLLSNADYWDVGPM